MYQGGAPGYSKTRMVSVGAGERALCPWLGGSIVGRFANYYFVDFSEYSALPDESCSLLFAPVLAISSLHRDITFTRLTTIYFSYPFFSCQIIFCAASLGSFHEMWVSKQEYDECGTSIIDRKCP